VANMLDGLVVCGCRSGQCLVISAIFIVFIMLLIVLIITIIILSDSCKRSP